MSDKPTDSTDSGTEMASAPATMRTLLMSRRLLRQKVRSIKGHGTFLSRFWAFVTHPFLLNVGMFLIPLAFAMWCTYPSMVSRSPAIYGASDHRQCRDAMVL